MASMSSPLLSASSFYSAAELSLTSQGTIPTLLGKSNFAKWHAAIDPILLSNEQARSLIHDAWDKASSLRSPKPISPISSSTASCISPVTPASSESSQSRLYTLLHAPALSRASVTTHQAAHREHEQANLTVCRFIRGTLAMNVIPFVRQHSSAKSLYEQLIYLYGEKAGIDMVGGPAAFGAMSVAFQGRRMTEPTISRISEEHDTSPFLPEQSNASETTRGRRMASISSQHHGSHSNRAFHNALLENPPLETTDPSKKKKIAFKFTNTFPFRRSTNTSSSSSPKQIISTPVQSASSPTTTWTTPSSTPPEPCSSTRKASNTSSAGASTSFHDFDFSYTARRKADVTSDAGTQLEMRSMAMNQDYETPKEEKESYFG